MPSSTGSSSTPERAWRARLEAWLGRVWYGGASAPWLLPLAVPFAVVVAARRALYSAGILQRQRVGVPVIVVGNLTVGGTGKTPLALWLVARLAAAGLAPGIATRGFGGSHEGVRDVTAEDDPAVAGDEPVLLARRAGVPVCAARDRVAAARRLVERGCRVVVCDDGLQHLRLAADFTIVVVDGARGLGNGRLLPAGPLREPPGRLRAADAVVSNGALQVPLPRAPLARFALRMGDAVPLAGGASRPLESFAGSAVHAVAGIGNPARFFEALRARGLAVLPHAFPDHHAFRPADLAFGDGLPVLLTEKDAVKCRSPGDGRLWFVPVDAGFEAGDEQELLARLAAVPGLGGVTVA